jgi:hypothetical protein
MGLDLADPAALTDDVAGVVDALKHWLDRVDPAVVADRLRERTWAQVRPEPVSPLAQASAAAALTGDSVLRLRARLRCVLREPECGRLQLVGGRRTHDFPESARPALAELLAVGELKVGDLPGLGDADRLALARRLVTESVAVVPDAGAGG